MKDSRKSSATAPGRARRFSRWLRDAPIGAKLRIVTLVFASAVLLQFGAAMAALELSEAIRAYILAEGLWSKAQKDGVIALRRYVRTDDPAALANYLQRMDVILGMRRARIEMDKPAFNAAFADEGFRLGGVRSSEAREDMIWLYRCCHGVSFFAEAVNIWVEGDVLIDRLMHSAETTRARIEAGAATPAFRDAVLTEVFDTNAALTKLENRFSNVLTDGAEKVHRLLLFFMGGASALVLLIAVLLALRITQLLREGTENLKQGIARLNAGDLTAQMPVLSSDEFGELAVTFNYLTIQRNRAEQAQRERDSQISAIVTAAVDGVIVIDESNHITMFNPAAERIFGYSTAEVRGQNVKVLMPEPYHGEHDAYVRNYLTTGVRKIIGIGREVVGKRKDGSTFPMDLAVAEIRLGDRRMFTGTVRDITERKAATDAVRRRTQELERANKELEQFAFATAHDLQTPLRGLVGYAQLLEEGKDRLEVDQLELINGIIKQAMGMHQLVQSLLEYTRISSQPNCHWADLNLLLSEAKDELQFSIKDRGAVIESEVLPTLNVDARQIAQLLRALLDNAIKFQPGQSPRVWLKAQRRGSEWVISVADSGIGIRNEHQQRIFQIFQRLHTSEQYEGAGIGLTLAEKIVVNHGGRIWMESEPGKGSTFFFSIPDA